MKNGRIQKLYEQVETQVYIDNYKINKQEEKLSSDPSFKDLKEEILTKKGNSYFDVLMLKESSIEDLRRAVRSIRLKEYMSLGKEYPDYNIDIPEDKLLLFHNTTQSNAENIAFEGLKAAAGKEQGRGLDGDYVWGTRRKKQKGYGGYTIAFVVDRDKAEPYKVNDNEYTLPFDIPAKDIVFIDEPVGLMSYRESDIKDLIDKYGADRVAEVLSNKTNLDSDMIGELISKSLNEGEELTREVLNNNPVKLSTYWEDSDGVTQHNVRDFDNVRDLFKWIKDCGGFSDAFDGVKWFIYSEYNDGEYYLVRDRFAKGGWSWEDCNGYSVDRQSKTFRDRDKIENTLNEWGEETSEDLEYRDCLYWIRLAYGDKFKIPAKAGLHALRNMARSAKKSLAKRDEEAYIQAMRDAEKEKEHPKYYTTQDGRHVIRNDAGGYEELDENSKTNKEAIKDIYKNGAGTWTIELKDGWTDAIGSNYIEASTKKEVLELLKSCTYDPSDLKESQKLDEANLQDLIDDSKASDPKRVELAKTIYTDYKGVDSDGTLIFESDSQTRSGLSHRQRVFYPGFFDLLDTVDAGDEITEEQVVDIITGDLMVDCSCFTGETLISVVGGFKYIKDIEVGDLVLTHTGQYKRVINVFEPYESNIVKVSVGTRDLYCTANHPFYTIDGEWIEIKDCVDKTLTCYELASNTVSPIGSPTITTLEDKAYVYNFEVEDDNSYCVGQNRVIVHNCESFLYYAWAYKSWKDGYGLMKELREPTKNNIHLKGGACKHVLSVLDLINRSNTLFDQVAVDLNELFQKYKKRTPNNTQPENSSEEVPEEVPEEDTGE